MSNLQDALDWWVTNQQGSNANPNIKAHREAFYALVEEGDSYNPDFIDRLIAAAFTPSGDDE